MKDVQPKGTTNQLMLGEKYLNPVNYATGNDPSDNESMFVGMDNDLYRCTYRAPMQDLRLLQDTFAFGSAHIGGSNIASSFGAAGALIVLLLWIFYSAQIFLLGAEFSRAWAHVWGSRKPDASTGGD